MSTSSLITPSVTLASIPAVLRTQLLKCFNGIIKNFRERRWEPSALNGGKFCECVYSILHGYVNGAFPSKPSKPSNMADACRNLEQAGSIFPRSVRIQIPRMMIALYEIRNNRGVGHVGGDVDPNHMDAVTVVSMANWILAELIRLFHGTDTNTAEKIVEALVERHIPIIWSVTDKLRVLDSSMSKKNQTLLLLYFCPNGAKEVDLISWTEHTNPAIYRRDILRKAHKSRLIEYDRSLGHVYLSPTGMRYVEDNLQFEL